MIIPGGENLFKDRLPPVAHLGKLIWTGPSPYSGHGIDSFMRCPQAWMFGWDELKGVLDTAQPEFSTRGVGPLEKGTMGHVGLAHYYRRRLAQQRGENPDEFLPPIEAVITIARKNTAGWESWVPHTQRAITNYMAHWRGELKSIEIVSVEATGYLDGVGRKHTRSRDLIFKSGDRYYIEDHKFVGRITRQTMMRYSLSGQFLDLTLMGRQTWGPQFGGVLINLITWGEETTFQREVVPPAEFALAQRLDLLQAAYAERDRLLALKLDPWRWPKRLHELVCQTPYGLCDAYDACRHGPEAAPGHSKLVTLPR